MRSTHSDKLRALQRRRLLRAALAAPLLGAGGIAYANSAARELRLSHTHTGEKLSVTYCENGTYLPDALAEINLFLRDFRTEEVCDIDPGVLDFVHRIKVASGSSAPIEIISAYRSPQTNAALRKQGRGVAKKSFHMLGRALDVRFTDRATADLRQLAVNLQLGGVGYYASSDFLHVDVGPVRQW